MKKEKDRSTESYSQSDVLTLMGLYPDTWFTSGQIQSELGVKKREKVAKFLRKLLKFDFIDRKRVAGTNELLYKLKEPKRGSIS